MKRSGRKGRFPLAARFGLLLILAAGAGYGIYHNHFAPQPFAPRKGPGAPNDWFYMQRAWPTGRIDHEARVEALAQARRMRGETAYAAGKRSAADWTGLGPTNVGGRITDIVADPSDTDIIYIGAASGGVWKTVNGGAGWSPIFDNVGSLSIGALAIDPTDSDVLYVGTGEANPGGGSVAYGGDGVWKTVDGGSTWENVGLADSRYIGRIVVDPADPSNVFVAATGALFSTNAERGVYRSVDAGTTWVQVLSVSDSTGAVDLALDPSNPDRIFATMWERIRRPETRTYGGPTSGLWRSEDGGDTWSELTNGLPGGSRGRIGVAVAVAPSSPSRVYAIYADATGYFDGLYRSDDAGDSWSAVSASGLGTFYSSYGWWFGRIWVNPSNANALWADGIYLYRSTNGGDSFSSIGNSMHADHHAQWFSPSNPNFILKGNDGGLYRSTNGGGSWSKLNTLPITQFYTIDVHPSEPEKVHGGAQDNGTVRTPGGLLNDWEALFGGDGHYVNVDPNDTDVIYVEYQYGNLYKSVNGGASFSSATSGISGSDRKNWSTPVVVDPASDGKPSTTLYYGANRLYRSTNSAGSWSAISGDLSDGFGGSGGVTFGTITTIAVAPSDSATIYVGTDDANVWVSTNYGSLWSRIDTGLPNRWVSRVAVDPYDDAVAYVTFSGLRDDDPLPHVFRTENGGSVWSDISGNLPDAPVNDIVVDPNATSTLYVATDVGVFVTLDLGGTWSALGTAMPAGLVATDLKIIADGGAGTLYAATYGRSAWSYDLSVITSVPAAAGDEDEAAAGEALRLSLAPNVPNPLRDETRIRFTLPGRAAARLEVIGVGGRRVRALADGVYGAGEHEVVWDGRDDAGRRAANGVYFYRLDSGGESASRKMTLMR